MLYVAMDIGCLECGESSAVIGIFTDRARAETARADHERRQAQGWTGEHSFEVFEVPAPDEEQRVEYARPDMLAPRR